MPEGGDAQMRRGQDGVRVRADGEKCRIAQVEEARETNHDVESDRHQHVDATVGGEANKVVAIAVSGELHDDRKEDRGEEHQGVGDGVGVAHVRAQIGPNPGHFSGTRIPRRPVGLNTSTKIKIEKMSTSVQAGAKYPSEIAATTPMMSPPNAAPGMFPMPPNTAAVNAISPYWKPSKADTEL